MTSNRHVTRKMANFGLEKSCNLDKMISGVNLFYLKHFLLKFVVWPIKTIKKKDKRSIF